MRSRIVVVLVVGALLAAVACKKGPASPPPPTKCSSDGDCAWSCEGFDDCCPAPCGCTIPMHAADKGKAEAFNREACTPARRKECPVVGGCGPAPPPRVLRCRAGACVSEAAGGAP